MRAISPSICATAWRGKKGYGEVTANDVVFTLTRMHDPKTGTAYGANFRQIVSVDEPDPYTVTINLDTPNPFFYVFALMPRFGGYIVPKKAVEEMGDNFRRNPIGSCPIARPICREQTPIMREIGTVHSVACHFARANPISV